MRVAPSGGSSPGFSAHARVPGSPHCVFVKPTDLPLPPGPQARPQSPPSPAAWRLQGLPWPLPAVLAWGLAWACYLLVNQAGLAGSWAWPLAALLGGAAATRVRGRLRQTLVAAGFPLSSLALGATLPAWFWLLPVLPLLLAYPLRAWSDAPFFPTPARALHGLAAVLPLPDGAAVLDAGCGLGHGLRGLHAAWPGACIDGVEWSAPLAALCAWRCPYARVRRGDMWRHTWTGYAVVYLFQRPESMDRAWAKACAEMAPGSWLVSLEFEVPAVQPWQRLDAGGGRPLWVYRIEGGPSSGSKKLRRGR